MNTNIIKLTKKQVLAMANIAREVYGLPKKYRYVAVDYQGDLYAYVDKPSPITSIYWGAGGESRPLVFLTDYVENWKELCFDLNEEKAKTNPENLC